MEGSRRSDEEVNEGPARKRRMARIALALSVVALLTLTVMVLAQDEDNSYMDDATYVGPTRCSDCHKAVHRMWEKTNHAMAFGPATEKTIVADWEVNPVLEVAPGVTVNPELSSNATGYYIDLDGTGTHVLRIDYVQGAGYWLQVYLTRMGNSLYILPMAWATNLGAWVPFHAEEWYDSSTGEPKEVAKTHTWDLMCGACHSTGFEIAYNETSGEWMSEWDEPGVTCESCHGPGSIHTDPPGDESNLDYIWRTEDSALCGNCHVGHISVGKVGGMNTGYPLSADGMVIRPGDDHADFLELAPDLHPDGEQVKGQAQQYNDYITSRHSHSLTTLLGSEDKEDFCLMCHSTDYKLAEKGSEPTLETAKHDIECALCHDMHGTNNENNLRLSKWETCIQCHRNGARSPGEDPLPPHREMVEGTIPIPGLSGSPWMGGDLVCTDCHMPNTAVRVVSYDIPSHTWYFVSPEKSIEYDMPNSCTVSCHKADSPGEALTDEEALAYIEESMAAVEAQIPGAETAVASAKTAVERALDLGFTQGQVNAGNASYLKAQFVLDFVNRDNSRFHNPEWQVAILVYANDTASQVVTDLLPGTVKGVVKDENGKAMEGLDIVSGNKTWATTGSDGSFSFDVAPGERSFNVRDGDEIVITFDATVTAGETTDAGEIEIEGEEGTNLIFYFVVLAVVIVILIIALVMARTPEQGGGEKGTE